MIALHESDYSDLIDPAFLPGLARLVVTAARSALAEEFAEAIETASSSAKAYHYKAAVAKAARVVRDRGHRTRI
jgi:homoserine dehydrogenase